MSHAATSAVSVALGLAVAIALASCGGGDAKLLPGTTAKEITENLESVRVLAAEGECVDAEDAAQEVSTQVDELQGIDPKLKEELQKGATKLNEVVLTCTEETTAEETEETLPPTTETKPAKPEKKKPEPPKKTEPEQPEEAEEETGPPHGEAKGHEKGGKEEGSPETPSGGIGPSSETGGGD
jgi:outer membrane biosynthesis protein TonB